MTNRTTQPIADPRGLRASVIIPAYNAAATLGECLDAALEQTVSRPDYEVIVVDDGSQDRTASVAEERGVRVIKQKNQGPAVARNAGAAVARGDVLVFTDADCVPETTWLAEMLRPFADAAVRAVKGAYRTRQRNLWARLSQVEFEERYRKQARAESIDFVDSYAAAFRRDVFEAVRGFDPTFPGANNEDVDLSYRMARRGYRMVFNPAAVVYHRHPSSPMAYLRTKFWRGYWRVFVYKRYPSKMVADSYTPHNLKPQALLSLLFLASAVWASLGGPLWVVALVTALLLVAMGSFLRLAARALGPLVLIAPVFLFGRSVALGAGVIAGFLSRKRGDLLFPTGLLTADIVCCLLSIVAAYHLRSGPLARFLPPFHHGVRVYLAAAPAVLVVWVAVFGSQGLYRSRVGSGGVKELVSVFRAVVIGVLALMAASFLYKYDYSRPLVFLFGAIDLVLSGSARVAIRSVQRRMLARGCNVVRALVVGTGESARTLGSRMQRHPGLGYRLVGYVSTGTGQAPREIKGLPVLGQEGELVEIVKTHRIDEVFVADPELSRERTFQMVMTCEGLDVGFKVVSDLFEIFWGRAEVDGVGDVPMIDLSGGRPGLLRRAVKRVMDIVVSALCLLIASPVAILVLPLLARRTGWPPWVRVPTRGRDDSTFARLRLPLQAHGVQSFFARRGLDWLPGLVNVLLGHMALVGPRPRSLEDDRLSESRHRTLRVRPGLTGLWRIASSVDGVEMDLYYVRNQSFLLDLGIMMRTIPLILFGTRGRQ
jgi:cellulose synthase/poly-beta-1,6-N-acetylglucosamine synthase-like glycosyltransferase/lipopolysaccharide/colanic/teichoic acid biosynthesis glycosyltransferase